MPACKRYKQLKLSMAPESDHYEQIVLSFKLHQQSVYGILNGTVTDWNFCSGSPVFLKYIPSGILYKYALWTDKIPKKLTEIYTGIYTAATKAGYNMLEREELIQD
jgi:hypothetical protein